MKVTLGPTNVVGITTSMIACENGIGNSLGGVASSRSSTYVPLPDSADPCTTPPSIGAVLCLLPATQPNQPGCVLDPLLTQPLLIRGPASFHNLLQGEAFALVWCNRSLPRISHLLDLSCSCWWNSVLDHAPRWAPNVPVG